MESGDTVDINDEEKKAEMKKKTDCETIEEEVPQLSEEEQKIKEDKEKFSINFETCSLTMKLAITNTTGNYMAICAQLEPLENCNMYVPRSQMNFNINDKTMDLPFVNLMKIDPKKPFGNFRIKVAMKEIPVEQYYQGNNLLMKAQKNPDVIDIIRDGVNDNISPAVQLKKEEPVPVQEDDVQ